MRNSIELEERKKQKKREHTIARHEKLKKLVSDIINPSMNEYVRYLNERGQNARISIHWHFFDITLEIHGNPLRTHGSMGTLEFAQVNDKIKLVQQIRGKSLDESYNADQITEQLVKNKVVDFIKKFFQVYV